MLKLSDMPQNIRVEIKKDIEDLYKKVTQELTQLPQPCTACGNCCHFDVSEHRLYASTLEFIYIFDKYKAQPMRPDSHVCPFLKNGKCSIRDRRMLGCRTYFRLHTKEERIKAEEIYESMLTLLKKLHTKYQFNWDYQDCIWAFQDEFGLENNSTNDK